jgi:hypothetical protein
VATRQYKPGIPSIRMAPEMVNIPPIAKNISSLLAFTYFMISVLINLLERNIPMATILYICAVALSIPRLSAY